MAGGTKRKGRAYHANVLIERARRLSEEWERERLLRTSINDDEICVICREKGDTQQIGTSGVRNVMVTLPCGHRFHDFCLEKQVLVGQHTSTEDAKKCAVCRQECVHFFDKLFPMCSEKHQNTITEVIAPPLRLVALQQFVFSVEPQWKRIYGTRLEMRIEFTCLSPGLKMLECSYPGTRRESSVLLDLRRASLDDVEYTCANVAVTFCTYIDFDDDDYGNDDDAYRRRGLELKPVIFRFSGGWRQFRVQVVNFHAGSCLDSGGYGIVFKCHEVSSRTAPAVTFEQPKEFTDEGRGISV